MKCVLVNDILDLDPLDGFKLVLQLANTADRHAETIVEVRVRQCDVGAVCLERDAVVPVVHGQVVEADMRGADRVRTIGVS